MISAATVYAINPSIFDAVHNEEFNYFYDQFMENPEKRSQMLQCVYFILLRKEGLMDFFVNCGEKKRA